MHEELGPTELLLCFQRAPLTSVLLQVNFEPQRVCMAACPSVPLLFKASQHPRAELCLQELVGGWAGVLVPWSPFSLHALVRVYYFLSSNCRFQVIISLRWENNIGSYVISTSMNLEVIMEWVDFFSSLKKRKINLRLFAYGWEYLWTILLVSSSHILPSAFVCGGA